MKNGIYNITRMIIVVFFLVLVCTAMPTIVSASEQENYSVYNDCLWFSQLDTEEAKFAYVRLAEALEAIENEVYFPASTGCTEADIRAAYEGISHDLPEYFYVLHLEVHAGQDNSGYLVRFQWGLSYMYATKEEVTQAKQGVDSKIDAFLRSIPSYVQTDYDKALYVHDYLANTISYELGLDPHSIYGALLEGKCVCAGYANAYTVLMRRLGIKTWYITGYGNNDRHAWNVSWIDGECVYTDVTWDDLNPGIRYKYFNISGNEMNKNHFMDDFYTSFLGPCSHSGHKYNSGNSSVPEETIPVEPSTSESNLESTTTESTQPVEVTETIITTQPVETSAPITEATTIPAAPTLSVTTIHTIPESSVQAESRVPVAPPVDSPVEPAISMETIVQFIIMFLAFLFFVSGLILMTYRSAEQAPPKEDDSFSAKTNDYTTK